MALHVPRAPGFQSMLKEGARVDTLLLFTFKSKKLTKPKYFSIYLFQSFIQALMKWSSKTLKPVKSFLKRLNQRTDQMA
jgi:hypothetical protein